MAAARFQVRLSRWNVKVRRWLRDGYLGWVAVGLCPIAIVIPHYLIKSGHHPPVGTYIAIMGGIAAAVALRRDPPIREKAAWIVLIACITVAEIRNLYITDQEQAQTFHTIQDKLTTTTEGLDHTLDGLKEVAISLQEISGQITTASGDSQKQFKATIVTTETVLKKTQEAAAMATEGVAYMTGGDSYVVVSPITIPVEQPNTFALLAGIGKNCTNRTLEDVSIQVRKLPIPNEGTTSDFINTLKGGGSLAFRGTLMAHTSVPAGKITPNPIGETNYVVNISSRNKQTVETLTMRRADDGAWEFSYVVGQDMMDGGPTHNTTLKTLEVTNPTWQRTRVTFRGESKPH